MPGSYFANLPASSEFPLTTPGILLRLARVDGLFRLSTARHNTTPWK
jgi:hypothetical protein